MPDTVHYTLRTTSFTDERTNLVVRYDVSYDRTRGIRYEVELHAPHGEDGRSALDRPLWRAKIVNQINGRRQEYDLLRRIYYQTQQTIKVESALYRLSEDLALFLTSNKAVPAQPFTIEQREYPGKTLHTLTIWYDPENNLPVRRENRDRGHRIVDEFTYHSIDQPLPANIFDMPRPGEAIANFDLYPEPPYLPRFEYPEDAYGPQSGVFVRTLVEEIRRFVIVNQWEYGPLATIRLPWLTEMPVRIYRARRDEHFPPLVVRVEISSSETAHFMVSYDFLGYVVTGFTKDPYDLKGYYQLPISTSLRLEELAPIYAVPSFEKEFVVHNFLVSLQSNDFFINAFDMGNKSFDLTIKNFSFHENEGYLILNVYGKEYWDNANIEAMFNYVVTGQMADAHTTPITIYALNSMKRLGIYREIAMPEYGETPTGETPR